MFELIEKDESLIILEDYLKNFSIRDLTYYLNNYKNNTIIDFLKENIYEPEDIQLTCLLKEHLNIVISKIFYLTTPLNLIRSPIKISFITDLIFWNDIFVINDTIFINYSYLIRVFDNIELNLYKDANQVYINKQGQIFDIELLKKLCISVYNVLQCLNYDSWIDFILTKYNNCCFVPISNIIFDKDYDIVINPNTNFISDQICVYWIGNKIYGVFDNITSILSYSPYYETIIIELEYSNGQYKTVNSSTVNPYNLVSNPFMSKAEQITNTVIL